MANLQERWIAVECHWARKRVVWLMESRIIYEYIPESFSSLLASLIEFLLNLHQPSCCAVNWNEDFSPCRCIESSARLIRKVLILQFQIHRSFKNFSLITRDFSRDFPSRRSGVLVNLLSFPPFSKLRLCECQCLPRETIHWKSPSDRPKESSQKWFIVNTIWFAWW